MRFVLVSGPPASGKSSLARPLATELDLPLIEKDTIKEAIGDALDAGGDEWTRPLSSAAFDVLWRLTDTIPRAVLEGNFYPQHVHRLRSVDPDALEIYCRCPLDLCRRRFAARIGEGRHRVHPPTVPPLEFFEQFAEPLGVGDVLEVSTVDPVDLDEIVGWVRERSIVG
jgi:hypothetical protein